MADFFSYRKGVLHCEEVPVESIAREYGTPVYIYSARTILEHYRKLRQAFAFNLNCLICYSVKANSNLSVLRILQQEGAGFDVVSKGEIIRALKVGADPAKIVFAGVGKREDEIEYALEKNILLFNVESEEEILALEKIAARMKTEARVALRVNPDVDPKTHTYIATGKKESKFGVDLERAVGILDLVKTFRHVKLTGIHAHIGSQITQVTPYVESLSRLTQFLPECAKRGHKIEWLDIGGGFGIFYKDKAAKSAKEIADALLPVLLKTGCKILLEPGRFIVGNAGILVTKVLYRKESGEKKFYICDGGMTELIRPTLYGAYHRIWPVRTDASVEGEAPDEETWAGPKQKSDVVGPICESGDFFAKDRPMPPVDQGALLAVFSAGAYGAVMSSNYNPHPRPAEILVSGAKAVVVADRETEEDILRREKIVNVFP